MQYGNSILSLNSYRTFISIILLCTALTCWANPSTSELMNATDSIENTTDSIDIPTNHNTKQHNFLTNSSLSITGLPWIMAGIALRNERKNIRELRNKFQPHFHHTADNYTQFVPLALTTGLKLAGVEGRSDTKRYLVSGTASFAIMATLVQVIKSSTKELRPDGSSYNSFPSGHTATAFAAATILHKEYGMTRSPWYSVAGYMLATATGCMRVLNNRHWASDTFSGAGIGILSTELGYTLGDLLFKNKGLLHPEKDDKPNFYTNPGFFNIQMGIGLTEQQLDIIEHLPVLQKHDDMLKRKLNLSKGIAVGIESAYFLNKYLGVGGRLMITSRNANGFDANALYPKDYIKQTSTFGFLDSYTLTIESNHMAEFSWSGGLYLNYPISKGFTLGSKLLIGRSYLDGISVTAEAKGHQQDIEIKYESQHKQAIPIFEIKGTPQANGAPYYSKWDFLKVDGDDAMLFGTGLSATFAYKSRIAWKVFLDYNFARRTYRTTYAPTLFLKEASQTMTLNGETIQHVADYVIPYTVSQKKGSAQTILGAAFSICF